MPCYWFIYGKAVKLDMAEQLQTKRPSVWKGVVHASFKKVIAFDLLFMLLGGMIGSGIITAILFH